MAAPGVPRRAARQCSRTRSGNPRPAFVNRQPPEPDLLASTNVLKAAMQPTPNRMEEISMAIPIQKLWVWKWPLIKALRTTCSQNMNPP